MQFGPPPERPEVSPWRWRRRRAGGAWRAWALILIAVVFVCHEFAQFDDGCNCEPDSAHQRMFDGETGFGWPATALVYLLACVVGLRRTAWMTLAVDAVLLGLGASLIVALVGHPEVLVAPMADNCMVREPFLVAAVGAVVEVALDVAALRPVFRRLRARRLPRATVRVRR